MTASANQRRTSKSRPALSKSGPTEETPVPTNTLTVSSAALLVLLRDVKRAAGTDSTLPMISGVMLHTTVDSKGTPVLAASATDRFAALHGHIPVSASLPSSLWLTNAQVAQVLAAIRPYTSRHRAGTSQVEIAIDGERVTVRQLSLDDLADISVTFAYSPGRNFPKVPEVIEKALARPASSDTYHVSAQRLAVFAQIAAARGDQMRIRSSGATKPVIVQMGMDLVGILMPVCAGSEGEKPLDVPVYALPVLEAAEEKAA